jgi:hypothetical protein
MERLIMHFPLKIENANEIQTSKILSFSHFIIGLDSSCVCEGE